MRKSGRLVSFLSIVAGKNMFNIQTFFKVKKKGRFSRNGACIRSQTFIYVLVMYSARYNELLRCKCTYPNVEPMTYQNVRVARVND